MNASEPVDNRAQRPHLTLASAVMFVADLERSVVFYQELLGFETTARTEEAALLVSPVGYQLYLRSMGKRAQHPIGAIGIQYLVWTAESEDDLQRCERVLKAQSPQVTSTVHGESVPGSVKLPRSNDFPVPSDAVWFAAAVTTGATFATTTDCVAVLLSKKPESATLICTSGAAGPSAHAESVTAATSDRASVANEAIRRLSMCVPCGCR